MSRFNPEMSRDSYKADYELTGRPGDPYRFQLAFDLSDGDVVVRRIEPNRWHIEISGMSMGDMQGLNRHIAGTIREARHAKQLADQETER